MARSIEGVVTLEKQPYSTKVVAVSVEKNPRVLNTTISDASTGSYSMNVTPWAGEVMVYAVQDYGKAWAKNIALSEGDVIHPNSPNGYTFKVTVAGTTGDVEPTWPEIETTVGGDGGVTYEGVKLIQPEINGYLSTKEGDPGSAPYGLFQGGGDGAFFDISEESSLFQDVAMTIPVTDDGQLVAAIKDLSGNGNHAFQPDPARQATYKVNLNGLNYLDFNPDLTGYTKELEKGDFYTFGENIANSAYTVNMIYHKSTTPAPSNSGNAVLFGRRSEDTSSNDVYGITLGQFNREAWNIITNQSASRWDTNNNSEYMLPTRISSEINIYNGRHESLSRSGRVGYKNYSVSKYSPDPLTIGDGSFNSGTVRSGRFRFYSMIVVKRRLTAEEKAELDVYQKYILAKI